MMNKKVEHFEEKINEINQNEYEDEDGGQGGGGTLDNYIFFSQLHLAIFSYHTRLFY